MTLDKAIEIYERGAKHTWNGKPTVEAEECQQMVEWLKDYKQLLEQYNGDIGEISDGYHTFNQLYHQRAILFATIVNQNADIAWKSYKHSDGKYCFDSNGEWFIVGVDTPEGSYTYHYFKEYWDYFKCKEIDCGKEWDGHTEEDVIRLLSLKKEPCDDAISRQDLREPRFITAENDYQKGWNDALESVYENAPSIQPQPKMGRWIDDKCSVCGKGIEDLIDSHEWYRNEQPNFCPFCGVKLVDSQESEGVRMSKSTLVIDTPKSCDDCPFCIFTAEEKRYIGYCHTSDDDYYCKVLDRFMEYDKVDGGIDILGKPADCPLQAESEE